MNGHLDLSPPPQGVIGAARQRAMEWDKILGELIDNSFDAGSMRVEISINGRELIVSDDGDGCARLTKLAGCAS